MKLYQGFFHEAKIKPPLNFVRSFAGTPIEEEIPKIEAKTIFIENVVCIINQNKK
jgi:hypothetical protein